MSHFVFSAINLGCTKNLVDLEFVLGEILSHSKGDIEFIDDPEAEAVDWVIVNTCGFLSSAREESEATLRRFDLAGKRLVLMGCYVPVRDDAFLSSLKNLWGILDFSNTENIAKLVADARTWHKPKGSGLNLKALRQAKEAELGRYLKAVAGKSPTADQAFVWNGQEVRAFLHSPFGHEYLKIAEGCDNRCTFCIIPNIRGRQRSRSIESVVTEARQMLDAGISELCIISQDTTRYGMDLDPHEPLLADLVEALDVLGQETGHEDFSIRLFYLYPDTLTRSHLERLSKVKRLIPYFDIPFQHASEPVLKRMNRCYDRTHIATILSDIRTLFPGAFIRTSFIVGFPGETDADFENLCQFVQAERFQSVWVFEYHDEPLAPSYRLDNKVDEATIHARSLKLGEVLDEIYNSYDAARSKTEEEGVIMAIEGKQYHVRRRICAPEVEPYDIISGAQLIPRHSRPSLGERVRYVAP